MRVRAEIKIDLAEYGGEGEVVMTNPGLRRITEMKNELGKSASITRGQGQIKVQDALQGDMEILGVLVYVSKAPFKCTVETFLRYCEELEKEDITAGSRLFEAMTSAALRLDKGEVSPLANCPPLETWSSD